MTDAADDRTEESGHIGSEPVVPPPIDEDPAAPSTTGVVAEEDS